VCNRMVTTLIWPVLDALNDELEISFPMSDANKIEELAQGFLGCSLGRVYGCVAAGVVH